MKERFIVTAAICLLCTPWCYGQAEKTPQVVAGEIKEAPLKAILLPIYKTYERGDLPLSLTLVFKIEENGSLSKFTTIESSGDEVVDKTGQEILWLLGESHLFGAFYGLLSNTVRVEFTQENLRLRITGFSPSQSEAMAKVERLRQVMIDVTRKAEKNSVIATLFRRVIISHTDKRVDMELIVPRAELLK